MCVCMCVRACTGSIQNDDDQLLKDDEEQTSAKPDSAAMFLFPGGEMKK